MKRSSSCCSALACNSLLGHTERFVKFIQLGNLRQAASDESEWMLNAYALGSFKGYLLQRVDQFALCYGFFGQGWHL